jgi:hypothetical protein
MTTTKANLGPFHLKRETVDQFKAQTKRYGNLLLAANKGIYPGNVSQADYLRWLIAHGSEQLDRLEIAGTDIEEQALRSRTSPLTAMVWFDSPS